MDSNGVPQKINRHVFKAVTHYSLTRKDGTRFSEVLEYVRLCNRNLKPVSNLKAAVRKALENFLKFGLIQKDKNSRYKIIKLPIYKEDIDSTTPATRKTVEPLANSELEKISSPTSRKRNRSSIERDDVETARKRFRSQKNLSTRQGRKANLPKARQAAIDSVNYQPDSSNYKNLDLAGNKVPFNNYNEDESLLREPGSDDRDSGDDLHIKSGTTSDDNVPNGDAKRSDVTEKSDHNPPKPESEENCEENSGNTNTENPGTSMSFAKNSICFRPYLN